MSCSLIVEGKFAFTFLVHVETEVTCFGSILFSGQSPSRSQFLCIYFTIIRFFFKLRCRARVVFQAGGTELYQPSPVTCVLRFFCVGC